MRGVRVRALCGPRHGRPELIAAVGGGPSLAGGRPSTGEHVGELGLWKVSRSITDAG